MQVQPQSATQLVNTMDSFNICYRLIHELSLLICLNQDLCRLAVLFLASYPAGEVKIKGVCAAESVCALSLLRPCGGRPRPRTPRASRRVRACRPQRARRPPPPRAVYTREYRSGIDSFPLQTSFPPCEIRAPLLRFSVLQSDEGHSVLRADDSPLPPRSARRALCPAAESVRR